MQGEGRVANKTGGRKMIHSQGRKIAISVTSFMKKEVHSGKVINVNRKQKHLSEATVMSSGTLKGTLRSVNIINEHGKNSTCITKKKAAKEN
jgi:hypothetical protein